MAKGSIDKEKIIETLEKLAYGYEYEDREIIGGRNGKPDKIKITKKHIPPDKNALEKLILYVTRGIL